MNKPSKKLQEIWRKRLAKSGFVDIERPNDETGMLRTTTTSGSTIPLRRLNWELQAQYYQYATSFLNDYEFDSNLERIIWEYHSNGISTRNISKILNKVRKKKILRMKVWNTITRLRKEMKVMYGIK